MRPSYAEDVCEEASEDAEGDEPGTEEQQDAATPAFDGGGLGLECIDCSLLGGSDDEGQAEHEDDDDGRGNCERDQRCATSSRYQGLCGQTGQDRTGSTESGSQVAEAEEREA